MSSDSSKKAKPEDSKHEAVSTAPLYHGHQPHVLILGAGLVSPPIIHYLASHGIRQTVASRTLPKTEKIIHGFKDVQAVQFDIEQPDALEILDKLTQTVDLVVSLLPYIHHVPAAKLALKYGKHFCTTSYVSADMEKLGPEAVEKGLILLNECGVDPGLDHMSAQKIIDEVHQKGGRVISFYSVCGGLPAPADNNNPFGYKLSWSPRGVLLAGRNDAIFLNQGQRVMVPGKQLYEEHVYKIDDFGGGVGQLEWYPNRDSVKYADIYSIPEVRNIVRGTYRNRGWCRVMKAIATLSLNSTDAVEVGGKTFAAATAHLFGVSSSADLREVAAQKLGMAIDDEVLKKFEWIGLFDAELVVPAKTNTALDALCFLFERKLQYAEGEKDMLVMRHTFEVEYPHGVRDTLTSTMIDFGHQPNGYSSMSRTVTLPVAAAVRAVLDGRLKLTGLVRPVVPEVYNPILNEMATLGISFKEEHLGPQLWLRNEVKPGEERVILTPTEVSQLLQAGFRVTVERSPHRCIADHEYQKVGATLVAANTWPSAPFAAIIAGLKELPDSKEPLSHRHLYFAHCYKNQAGWAELLDRFGSGQGLLWDLEFLVDDAGRRVAAFGRPAGIAGMGVGVLAWSCQQLGQPIPTPLTSWKSSQHMIDDVKTYLERAKAAVGYTPTVLVLGALGRCGGGAVWVASQLGLPTTQWDLAETKSGGPFFELLQHNIVLNAIYLSGKIPPFISEDMLAQDATRKLTTFVDVSCDTSNPNNPFPIYRETTTLFHPVMRIFDPKQPAPGHVKSASALPLDVIAIDHLPSLVPMESSVGFAHDLLPHVLSLKHPEQNAVWIRARKLFEEKLAAARAHLQQAQQPQPKL